MREARRGALALVFASAASGPENGWGHGRAGRVGPLLRWRRARTCRGPSGGCGHLPRFRKWSVTLIHCTDQSPWPTASWDPPAAANSKMPAGHGTEDALASCLPWPVRTAGGTWAPIGRARECLFKKRQAANHNEVCNCPSVAQIKKKFFSFHCQKFL